MFGVLSLNRGYLDRLGGEHAPVQLDTPLALPRAHLNISDEDARIYRSLVTAIQAHLHNGQLVAGPDSPEVYFLAGLTNPSGKLYDLFSEQVSDDLRPWLKGQVIVVNHDPPFAPRLSEQTLTALRREFFQGEKYGNFEIRWR